VLSHLFYPGTAISRAPADQYSQQVAFIQLRLHDLGYHVIIDGKYGLQTEAAVRHYQTDNGFTVDGIVGLQTWQGLFGLGPA
jgi:peptidoglycan hydrolase-like protein with peptidoglycan-binding domain